MCACRTGCQSDVRAVSRSSRRAALPLRRTPALRANASAASAARNASTTAGSALRVAGAKNSEPAIRNLPWTPGSGISESLIRKCRPPDSSGRTGASIPDCPRRSRSQCTRTRRRTPCDRSCLRAAAPREATHSCGRWLRRNAVARSRRAAGRGPRQNWLPWQARQSLIRKTSRGTARSARRIAARSARRHP